MGTREGERTRGECISAHALSPSLPLVLSLMHIHLLYLIFRVLALSQCHPHPHTATQTVDALYRAYFEEAKNLADFQVLIGVAESVGLDAEEVRVCACVCACVCVLV